MYQAFYAVNRGHSADHSKVEPWKWERDTLGCLHALLGVRRCARAGDASGARLRSAQRGSTRAGVLGHPSRRARGSEHRADVERTPSVDVPEEAFDQEEDELGATLFAAFFLLFFSVFWVGGTAVATVVITGDLVEQHRTRTWEETPGTMEWSAVDTVTNCDGEGCSVESCVAGAEASGSEGQMAGDQLSTMEDCYESRRLADKLVERYPAGADVTVYHHPENINETVLETGLALRYM